MSNTSIGEASKGSKLLMQRLINESTEILNQSLKSEITWISPVKDEKYREYRLNQVADKVRINRRILNFWPSKGPQWDAIGHDDTSLYIVEAKAHTSEDKCSGCSAKKEGKKGPNPDYDKIIKALQETFNNTSIDENSMWFKDYYQIANRYAFLDHLLDKGINVKLVFIYFVGDKTNISTSKEDWEKHINDLTADIEASIKPDKYAKLKDNVERLLIEYSTDFSVI